MKKGFTLVELLAVIAILAILAIIALPNVMDLFNEAKKNSFANEVRNIFKATEQKYMQNAMYETNDQIFARVNPMNIAEEAQYSQLDLSGRTNIEYAIKIDSQGKVLLFYVTDGTYFIAYRRTGSNELKIEDITIENTRDFTLSTNPLPEGTNDNIAEVKEVTSQMCNNGTVSCTGANIHLDYNSELEKTLISLVFNSSETL